MSRPDVARLFVDRLEVVAVGYCGYCAALVVDGLFGRGWAVVVALVVWLTVVASLVGRSR